MRTTTKLYRIFYTRFETNEDLRMIVEATSRASAERKFHQRKNGTVKHIEEMSE